MRLSLHLFLFRATLFTALLVPSLNCVRGDDVPAACGCDGCGDPQPGDVELPPEVVEVDDDDSAATDDDDAAPEVDLTALLPVCSGGVFAALAPAALEAPADGSGDYDLEPADLLATVWASFADLMDGYPAAAVTDAALVDYELCRGDGDERGLALWRPVDRSTGSARVVFRSLGASPFVVGAPHAVSAPETLEAAAAVFEETSARVLIVGATHRCASDTASPCAGSTVACGDGEEAPAAISDMAGADGTVFHVAHAFWADEHPDDWIVTIDTLDDDGMAVSDGTRATVPAASTESPANAVRAFAERLAAVDEDITTCNPGLALPVEDRACGEQNQQGRLINQPEASLSCVDPPDAGAGRYVHLAAAPELLGPDTVLVDVFARTR